MLVYSIVCMQSSSYLRLQAAGSARKVENEEPKAAEMAATSIEEFSADVAASAVSDGINSLQIESNANSKARQQQQQSSPDQQQPSSEQQQRPHSLQNNSTRLHRTSTFENTCRCVHLSGYSENILKALFWLYQASGLSIRWR